MSRPKRIVTNAEKEKICQNYLAGKSIKHLQKETKLQTHQIKAILIGANINVLSAKETQIKNGAAEYKEYFDLLNPLQSYVLGLIFGDGCVHYNPIKYKYAVTLTSNDMDILQSAQKVFGDQFQIRKRKTAKAYNLVVNSKHVCQELISKFNLQSPKSNNLIFPKLPDDMYSFFISGLLSTDGCIEIRKNYIGKPCAITFSYSSNCLDFIEKLQSYLIERLNITKTTIKQNKTKRKNINYSLRYSGNQAATILEFIYKDTNELTRCDRKYKIYTDHLTSVSNSIMYRTQCC